MDDYTSTIGVVPRPRAGLEVLTSRYSMNTNRRTSVASSIHEFRAQEEKELGGQNLNTKYLRDQFSQRELDQLYEQYDDNIKENLVHIYIGLIVIFSTAHITLVVIGNSMNGIESQSLYISLAMYVLRIIVPLFFLIKCCYLPLKEKWLWMPVFVTFVITIDLVITDVAIPILSHFEGIPLRPAYSTMVLLSIYIFLPLRNNFMAIILGVVVSCVYVVIYAFFTYHEDPQIGVVITSDILYLIGVNLMGLYFRLMNEIVTKRAFLDILEGVERALSLESEKKDEEKLIRSTLGDDIGKNIYDKFYNLLEIHTNDSLLNVKAFNSQFIQAHESVSILYADVVNYTMISTTLRPIIMVELLNELFGQFDSASRANNVVRIKFLGDCYYCVSGLHGSTKTHAKNCIELGFEMINIIKEVRERIKLDIDMRIGVHSGRVLSGLVGLLRWQFDVWSKDVTIANKMESTGQAGKVHITRQTLDQLKEDAKNYIVERNLACRNHPFIVENHLETYLLSKPKPKTAEKLPNSHSKPTGRTSAIILKKGRLSVKRSDARNSSASNIRGQTSTISQDLIEFQENMRESKMRMEKEINNRRNESSFCNKSLNTITLMYKDLKIEKEFLQLPDPLFKYYIICCLAIICLILIINGLITNGFSNFHWYTWSIFVLLFTIIIILQPLTWFQHCWKKRNKNHEEPRNRLLRYIYDTSQDIIKSARIRTVIYFVICLGLAATSAINVISCTDVEVEPYTINSNCVSSWHVTQCWGLALLLNCLFIRVFFVFKWIIASILTTFYLWVVWKIKSSLYAVDATWNIGLDPRVSHTLSVVLITISLYWIDRTTEFRNRLDYLWQIKLNEEEEGIKKTVNINNMLLENILPPRVVNVYLNPAPTIYTENYDNVAVIFASVSGYDVKMENDERDDSLKLTMLNEVISEFDKILMDGFPKVDKIKVAGWTYMAACGLDPIKGSFYESAETTPGTKKRLSVYEKEVVVSMVEFGAEMMSQLKKFNRSSFQDFSLRIGISNGSVTAGVIGLDKPFYDIWGHAVNMASRMDSTGECGKIQVTENTAIVLEQCGYVTGYRGKTYVKGAGDIKTYFVPLDDNFSLKRKEECKRVVYQTTDFNYNPYGTQPNTYYYIDSENSSLNGDNSYDDFYNHRSVSVVTKQSYDPADNDSYSSLECEETSV